MQENEDYNLPAMNEWVADIDTDVLISSRSTKSPSTMHHRHASHQSVPIIDQQQPQSKHSSASASTSIPLSASASTSSSTPTSTPTPTPTSTSITLSTPISISISTSAHIKSFEKSDSSHSNNSNNSFLNQLDKNQPSNTSIYQSFDSINTSQTSLQTSHQSKQLIKTNAFLSLFPTLPKDTFIIKDVSCAWQKDILIQGRLYITPSHICFYANILSWIHSIIINVKDVKVIEKRLIAGFIPNSIEILTSDENYFFATFHQRDHTFDLLSSVCEKDKIDEEIKMNDLNSLLKNEHEQERTPEKVKGSVQEKEGLLNTSSTTSPNIQPNSMPVGLAQILSPCVSPSRIIHSSDIHKSLRTSESGSSVSRDSVSITSPTIIHQPSPTPIQIKDNLSSSKYTCSHITSTMTQVLNETFPITCQTLFNVYYSNKATHQFWKRFLEKRNCKNITVTDWVTPIAESSILLNNDTPIKEMTRNCGYIQPVNSTLVKESVCEIVEVCVEAHNNGFCIESKTYTRNVPAGNTFYTKVHVCCSQSMMDSTVSLGSTKSSVHLTVKCEVVFEKFSFLKSMIVAGCIDGMRKVYSELNDELRLEILEKNLDTLLVKMERVNECSMVVGCATKESEQKRDDDIEVHETTTNEKVQDTRSDVLDNIVALALQDPRIQRLIEVLTTILCVLVAILAINVYVLVFK